MRLSVLALVLVRWVVGVEPECTDSATPEGILGAFRRGDYDCAVAAAKATRGQFENEVALELRTLEKTLKDIKEALKPQSSSVLVPAYQWAQSGREVFVSVKFAHKLDAPATLVNQENIDEVAFGNRSVKVRASKSAKTFELALELLRDINPENSTFSSASVGRATLTLRKSAPHREWWPRLLASKTKPPNQHVWWDKQESFQEEQEDVEKEEKERAKEAKKAAKDAAAKKDAVSSDEANETAPVNASSNETATAADDGETAVDKTEPSPEKVAERALTKRKADIRKAAANRKKEADDRARDQRRAINEDAKLKIAHVDDTLRKAKEDIDAETNVSLAALDAADPTLQAPTSQVGGEL